MSETDDRAAAAFRMSETDDRALVLPPDPLGDVLDREAEAEGHKVMFWSLLEQVARLYGVEMEVILMPNDESPWWDMTRHPPQLLTATVHFERRDLPRRKRKGTGA